jgi:hypothetical protein
MSVQDTLKTSLCANRRLAELAAVGTGKKRFARAVQDDGLAARFPRLPESRHLLSEPL